MDVRVRKSQSISFVKKCYQSDAINNDRVMVAFIIDYHHSSVGLRHKWKNVRLVINGT